MKRVKLIVAYDGTNYCGWQVQPNGITVQEVLNRALSDLLGEEIPPIPLWTNFADTREKTSPARRRIKPAPEENKNTTFRLSLIMNIVMVIAIIAMFIITLNSDQPNVLNYERNLQNKYATWEQELTQREQTVREKERELHIETEVSQN